MQFIKESFSTITEIKKSKFIAHFIPYKEFDKTMQTLKENHPKARHFVYSYRYLNEFDQVVENSSDDGEPKGTSGRPTLSVLSGADIINSAVIVVRYFGGIRLGTGGLVKAYSDAVNLVLESSNLYLYVKLLTKTITLEYTLLSQVEYMLKSYEITIIQKDFKEVIILTLEGSCEEFERLSKELFRGCILEDTQRR